MRIRWLLFSFLILAPVGCVERRFVVKTDPPGAAIYVDGQLRGTTGGDGELEIPFVYYGTRTVVARHTGHRPERRQVELEAPWYQIFPLGFFSEILWPGTIEDVHRPPAIVLRRRPAPSPADAVEREAKQFRESQERHW